MKRVKLAVMQLKLIKQRFGIHTALALGSGLVCVLVLILSARLVLGYGEMASQATPTRNDDNTTSPQPAHIEVDALFGHYNQPRQIEITSGQMLLTGVFASNNPETGSAVIALKGQKPRLFAVGDTLPGGFTLLEVYEEHVVLSQGDTHNVLKMKRRSL